jgi:hypothetical protein
MSTLPEGLAERAMDSVKRVRFFPAEKEGRLVSQYITFEYIFRIY